MKCLLDHEVREAVQAVSARQIVSDDVLRDWLSVPHEALLLVHEKEKVRDKGLVLWYLRQVVKSLACQIVDPGIAEEQISHRIL